MRFVYPSLPYQTRTVYPPWEPECEWARAYGLATGLVDLNNGRCWLPTLAACPTPTVYRGRMLLAGEYTMLARLLPLVVPAAEYLASYEASGWYAAVASYLFPGRFLAGPVASDFTARRRYFTKRLVKSFGTASTLNAGQLAGFWQVQEPAAGAPLFVRDFTELRPGSKRRFFVVRGHAYGAEGATLPAVLQPALAALQPRQFCSFVASTSAGQPVLVEMGDGQASDLKEWSVAEFGERVLRTLAAG